jgi:hypothetical protein
MEFTSIELERINRQNKACEIMGDFNIDLSKIESYAASDKFLDVVSSIFFNHIYYNQLE